MDEERMILWERAKPLIEPFVKPIYLSLLHANFTQRSAHNPDHDSENERSQILAIANSISDHQIKILSASPEWRGRLVAGWCVGLTRRDAFIDEIAELLLASVNTYSGQGYCVALGLIGGHRCRLHLQNYLSKYLPPNGRIYDQLWAIGALAHIDPLECEPFLASALWVDSKQPLKPTAGIQNFKSLVDYLKIHKMALGVSSGE